MIDREDETTVAGLQPVREIAEAILELRPFTDADAQRVAAAYLALLDGQENT